MQSETENEQEQKPTKTILIFGLNSFIGSNLAEFFKKDYRVAGTYHKTPVHIPGVLALPCDVLKKNEIQLVIYMTRPDIVIYAIGVRSVFDANEKNELADALNTNGLFNVAEYAQRKRAQICSITSHYVFSGMDEEYVEMDIPDADTVLGKSQSSAEFYIQKTALNYLIFRCCNLYGRSSSMYQENFFETLQRKIFSGETAEMDDCVRAGFLDIMYLATIMKLCFEKGVNNRLFQVSSSDIMSYYQFAKTYTRVFHESEQSVVKRAWNFPLMGGLKPPDRMLNYSLDNLNIESFLNIKMPTIEESLKFTFKRFNGEDKKSKRKSKGDGINYI